MKTSVKLLLPLFLASGLLYGAAFEKVATSPATNVTLSSQKHLTAGNNLLSILVADEKYKDAQMSVKVFMPEMPGMPAMENESQAKNLGDGKYETEVNFSMRGTWQVYIFITPKEGKKVKVKTSINI
jgi:hypothetical protein